MPAGLWLARVSSVSPLRTIFAAPSVEAILEQLDRDGSDFARAAAETLRARSPTSLKLVYRLLHAARGQSLTACLALEYRLAMRVIEGHDFREGVRAALVDKDRKPDWRPASLAAVPEQDIDAAFAPLAHEAPSAFVADIRVAASRICIDERRNISAMLRIDRDELAAQTRPFLHRSAQEAGDTLQRRVVAFARHHDLYERGSGSLLR